MLPIYKVAADVVALRSPLKANATVGDPETVYPPEYTVIPE
jgi:hypothetical protein